jgi:large conductance mechanosensitive channel
MARRGLHFGGPNLIKEATMAERKSALAEFKDFVIQGNVVDLAVAVVIAMFFGAVIRDAVNFILNILAVFGKHTAFEDLAFHIRGGTFRYGLLMSDIITFGLVAAVVFVIVVRPLRTLQEQRSKRSDPESTDRPCPECRSQIPKEATRCAYCTTVVPPMAQPVA